MQDIACEVFKVKAAIQVQKIYPISDIFLYPTLFDSFGMVLLEAMSFGMPVITLHDFSTSEIIDNEKDGFVVEGYSHKWYDSKDFLNIHKDWDTLVKYIVT